jgi:hypothetical protein
MSDQPTTKQPWVTPELHIEPGASTEFGIGVTADGSTANGSSAGPTTSV